MADYTAGIIGTGTQYGGTEETGMAMGYRHGEAYVALDNCDLVACADTLSENAERFADYFGIGTVNAFTDHATMLREVDLDIVSITTPIPTHTDIVIDCAKDDSLRAIHCEKPMADTWGDAKLMAQECGWHDVQLTFNHQLRFSAPVRRAMTLIDKGTIGEILRVEASRDDLFEAGTHQMDLCSYFAGDVPAEWVLGAVDYREEEHLNGVHIEDQALGHWMYENGVHGIVSTGDGADGIGCLNRVIGTEGVIEVNLWGDDALRLHRVDQGWESVECDDVDVLPTAVAHTIECLSSGEEPLLSARRALIGTELIYGIYESARRRGRIDLPLVIEDNPLDSMIETGDLNPT